MTASNGNDAEAMTFASDGIEARIDRGGVLRCVRNVHTGEQHAVSSDRTCLEFDGFTVELPCDGMEMLSRNGNGCGFGVESNGIAVSLAYAFPQGRSYFDRTITLTNRRPDAVVLKV